MKAKEVTRETLPPDLVQQWMTPDGQARSIAPSGNANDNDALRAFATPCSPSSLMRTEGPISILEARHTVLAAFIEAGACALLSIAILLWITLRRIGDVLLTLIPLLLAGVVTLEICVADRHAAQFRQHHRVAAAARRRRGVQDLLHHGVARGADQPACNRC